MSALTIIMAALLLVVLLGLGALMSIIGTAKLKFYWTTSPSVPIEYRERKRWVIPLSAMVTLAGLFCVFWGVFGIYSLILNA